MHIQQIHIVINKDGQVEIKVDGVTGMSCLEITQALEAALGGEVIERKLTAEAYEVATETQTKNIYGA